MRESDYWEMTLGEVQRQIEAIQWQKEQELKQQASFVYALPQLIACAVGQLFDGKQKYPSKSKVFPELFNEEEERTQKSIQRFIQFAHYHNNKMNSEVK